ncbi:hypothetical protein PoMZ_03216 [Pyricularia oryzae]|uniref:Uncharacterized protein n=1 Tax=Pyricularia oryzae TaxID=318829 RepID=A0A4P7NA95_PYROR|nr:hypothetical protein PoMZ_03216 [Pyricularia oryzae]
MSEEDGTNDLDTSNLTPPSFSRSNRYRTDGGGPRAPDGDQGTPPVVAAEGTLVALAATQERSMAWNEASELALASEQTWLAEEIKILLSAAVDHALCWSRTAT